MRIVTPTAFDLLVASHSSQLGLKEELPGVIGLSFGPERIFLTESAARDFLHELAAFLAQIDLRDFGDTPEAALQESRLALQSISALRGSGN